MRKIILGFIGLVFVSASVAADEKAKPLTRQEITDGWLQLFDGESLFGWTTVGEGQWVVTGGALSPAGPKPATLVSTSEFGSFELKVEYKVAKDASPKMAFFADDQGQADFRLSLNPLEETWGELTVLVADNRWSGEIRALDAAPGKAPAFKGDRPIENSRGHIAFIGTGVVIRSVKLKPLATKPLFNGKDLTGWKVFPGDKYKSEFTVTKEGAILVKNGPGDLQTEGQWADFVLQLECVSNGKFLNSGVFFRARPNEYQQGYEAQIRNEFKDEPTQEYTLEVHDPKTHELKEKVKAKYAAVDFGTGAIYRRQPARKAVAKDLEWFTMTVMANGRHFATWVDGVQVADWTDHQPLKDNARNGCCLEKGCISFQGHDPTTDLSFRNIRIAELPPK